MPPTPKQNFVSRLINFFADEWLLLPAMWYRWGPPENRDYLIYEFGMVSAGPGASPEEVTKAGQRAYRGFKATVTSGMLGINEDTVPSLEKSYVELLGEMSTHLCEHQYMLGDRPSLADFGLMAPLYAHLGRDPAPQKLMKTVAPRVADWVERMNGLESARVAPLEPPFGLTSNDLLAWARSSTVRGGEWLPDDEIPKTLLPLLRRQFSEQMPVARANSSALEARLAASGWPEGASLPGGMAGISPTPDDDRGLGWFESQVYGVPTSMAIRPNVAMMAQNLVDAYGDLDPAARVSVDTVLEEVGGADAVEMFAGRTLLGGCRRLKRRDFKLWVGDSP